MAAPQRWRSVNTLMKQLPAVPKPAPRVVSTSQQRPAVRGRLPLDASTRQLLAARLQKPPLAGPRTEAGDTPQQLPDTVAKQAGLPTPPRSAGCGPAAAVTAAAPGCGSQQAVGAAISAPAAAAGGHRAASHRHGARPPTQWVSHLETICPAMHISNAASPQMPTTLCVNTLSKI